VPPQKQTNIRLDETSFEWLENIAHVHRRSVADELRMAVEQWVEQHKEDPRIRATRELRDPSADESGTPAVSSLDARRKRKPGQSDA
jgi:predicted DNA-binding protein